MKRILVLMALMLSSLAVHAAETDRDRLTYTGSRSDQSMQLNTETMRTEYRWVQVPYQERVCRYETRYRQECRQEPGRRVCRTENRQVCERRNVCRPGRDGQQRCRVRRVCRSVPRRVCRTEPGRRVCRSVPYQERVCRYETRYRQERRAYQVIDSRTQANINFNFNSLGDNTGLRVEVNANLDRHRLDVNAEDFSSPSRVLLAQKRSDRNQNGRDTFISESYQVDLKPADRFFSPIRGAVDTSEIVQGVVELQTATVHYPEDTRLRLRVSDGNVLFDRQLSPSEFRWVMGSNMSRAIVDLRMLLGSSYEGRTLQLDWSLTLPREKVLNSNQYSQWDRNSSASRVWR